MIHETVLLCSLGAGVGAEAARRLSDAGLVFFTAATPSDGLRLMEREGTSVIVVGGGSTGEVADTCHRFRAAERGKSVVIVAVVSDAREAVTALDAGADDFFVDARDYHPIASRILVARRRALGITSQWQLDQDRAHFLELSPEILLCEAGHDGRLTKVSPGWTALLGWTSVELLSAAFVTFVLEEDRAAASAAWARVAHGREVIGFTTRFRHRDGTHRILDWRVASWPERDVVYAVVSDATAARTATETLRHVSESLTTTLNSIGDGVIAMDLASAVTQMNPVAERLTGWTFAEARGRPASQLLRFIDGDTRREVESPLSRALHAGVADALPEHCLLVRRDGTEMPIADSCAPITSADGTVSGAVLVFRDLTEQLRTAAEHARVRQQLVFADRMAALGTLSAGVAHEINNPLCYVGANVELALEAVRTAASPSAPMKDLEEMLVEAQDGVDRVAKIVRSMKTFSRVDQEQVTVVDLVAVLEVSISMAFNEIRPRARLVREFGAVPTVLADGARLVQVFVNLLVNAAHSFPEGLRDENEIRLTARTDPRGQAVVEVRDTGSGMPAAVLEHAFDPFFTTKPAGVGTGLGLATSHGIVTAIGGEITVESELGRGTVFRVTLLPSTGAAGASPVARPALRAVPARSGTVLVVDDEPALGLAIRRVLSHHDVTVVTSADAALQILESGKEFDVVLSDLMMPGMSGMELYQVLAKRIPKMASRLVFVTGGAFTPEAHRFLDQVVNERIEKPFASDDLRTLVGKFVH